MVILLSVPDSQTSIFQLAFHPMFQLLNKFAELPRSMKWLVVFLLFTAVYFLVVEPALDQANQLNTKADRLALGLKQERDLLSTDSAKGKLLADGRRLFGEPLLPGDPANRPEAIHTAVDKILSKNGVTKSIKNERRIPFRGDELANLLGSSIQGTAERIVLDLAFEASPEAVTAIITQLEQAPEIALVGRVELRRPDAGRDPKSGAPVAVSRTLKVTVSPEAWIVNTTSGSAAATTASAGTGGAP